MPFFTSRERQAIKNEWIAWFLVACFQITTSTTVVDTFEWRPEFAVSVEVSIDWHCGLSQSSFFHLLKRCSGVLVLVKAQQVSRPRRLKQDRPSWTVQRIWFFAVKFMWETYPINITAISAVLRRPAPQHFYFLIFTHLSPSRGRDISAKAVCICLAWNRRVNFIILELFLPIGCDFRMLTCKTHLCVNYMRFSCKWWAARTEIPRNYPCPETAGKRLAAQSQAIALLLQVNRR